jgi:hypothetical protein
LRSSIARAPPRPLNGITLFGQGVLMKWPAHWESFANDAQDDALLREFRREAPADHVLANVPLRTVGTHPSDNVLFELLDGSGRFAAVHLTFSKNRETDPRWPDTTIYDNWEHFEREGEDF